MELEIANYKNIRNAGVFVVLFLSIASLNILPNITDAVIVGTFTAANIVGVFGLFYVWYYWRNR